MLLPLRNFFKTQTHFQKGIWWNGLSFIILGFSGICLNVLLLIKYGAGILGAFNQVYAVYILASQLAAFGLYASVLKYTSQHTDDKNVCGKILTAALILGAATTTIIAAAYYVSIPFVGRLLGSSDVRFGLNFALVGLWCFPLNKILLSFINGRRRMKAFAFFNSLRYLMLPSFLLLFIILDLPGYMAPLVFSLTESVLLIGLLSFVLSFSSLPTFRQLSKWLKLHFFFGVKSLVGGSIIEINSRIDVLMLGYFAPDALVGVYSFAAMFSEGMGQIPRVFLVNYNPLLTRLVVNNKLKELKETIINFLQRWIKGAFPVSVLAILCFPLVAATVGNLNVPVAWAVFAILMAGIFLKSGYDVFWELPSQSGHPGWQTILIVLVALSNAFLNYLMIRRWGIYGAALATSISYVLGVFYWKIIVRRTLKVSV